MSERDSLVVVDSVGRVLAMGGVDDGPSTYGNALRVLAEAYDATLSCVIRFDDDGAAIVGLWSASGFNPDPGIRVEANLLPPGMPVRKRRIPLVFPLSAFGAEVAELLELIGPGNSMLVAPITEAETVTGAVAILAAGVADLAEHDRTAVQLSGELLWRHMRDYESRVELYERAEVAEILATIGARLHRGGIAAAREVLDEVFEMVGAYVGANQITTVERVFDQAVPLVEWDSSRIGATRQPIDMSPQDWDAVSHPLDFSPENPFVLDEALVPGCGSGIVLPTVIDGHPVGLLAIGWTDPAGFRPAHRELIIAMFGLLSQFRVRIGAELALVRRGVVEQVRTETAESFINAPADQIDATVLAALQRMGGVFSAGRVCWVEVVDEVARTVVEWDDGDGPEVPTDFTTPGGLGGMRPDIREPYVLSPSAAADLCRAETPAPTIVVPAVVGDSVKAVLTLTGPGFEHDLPEDERRSLIDLAGLIYQARERAGQSLAADYRRVLDDLQLRLAARFLDRRVDEVGPVVEWALGELGAVLRCDLIAFAEYIGSSEGSMHWWNRGATGIDDAVQAFAAEADIVKPHFAWVLKGGVPRATRTRTMPPEQREIFESVTNTPFSMLVVPFRAPGIALLLGVSVFHDRIWSPTEEALLSQIIGQIRQFIDVVAGRKQLQHDAGHDSLTGLANRRNLSAEFDALIEEGRTGALLMIDIDRFKVVNDSLGHSAGDAVLVAIADRIQTSVRGRDLVGRFGGDEFAVLVRDGGSDFELAATADRLISVIREPVIVRGTTVIPTCSIGIANAHDGDDVESVLRHADAALYEAKAKGRDRYEFFDDDHRQTLAERLYLETALRRGVSAGDFLPWFQPEYDLVENEIIGVEALVRWNHPTDGIVDAARFIDTAEEIGLAPELSRLVMDESFRTMRRWMDEGFTTRMRFNVAAAQLQSRELAEQVGDALTSHGISPDLLCIEITERSLMLDLDTAIDALGEVRRLGVEVAVDDFGTGFSSLGRLKDLPVDTLKIDRSFVNGIVTSATDREIVRTIIGLSRGLGLDVVAEGVEHREQADMLLELGCRRAQGWLWSPAVPADQVPRLARV